MTVNTIIIVKNHPEYDPESLVVGSNQDWSIFSCTSLRVG